MSTGDSRKGIRTTGRGPVEFRSYTDSDGLQNRLDCARQKEVVVWILIVLLGALNIAAFYLMWLRANGWLAG